MITICDLNISKSMEGVDETLARFAEKKCDTLPRTDLKRIRNNRMDHNNIADTEQLGLIQKNVHSTYTLTELGKAYIENHISQFDLIQRQISIYNMTLRKPKFCFPYRAFMKVFLGIEEKKSISDLEYMLCIYPMEDDSAESIESTVAKIRTLRLEYPNLRHISTNNRDAILTELNSRFGTTLEVDDIWGTRTTTVKNQFYYLRDHLCQFTSIFEKDRTGNIVLKDSGVEELTRLLEQSKRVETLSREDFLAYYRSLSDVN